jgi:hypothetical protein
VVALSSSDNLWTFPVDVGLRRKLFCAESFSHPAKLHLGLLQRIIDTYTQFGETILDPMAGTGSLMLAATVHRNVVLRELEQDYVAMINASVPLIRRAGLFLGVIDVDQADARYDKLPWANHIITSPPYGFEVGTADSWARRKERLLNIDHDERWQRKFRNSTSDKFHYAGGRENTGNKSGRNYWKDMELIYQNCYNALPSGGLMILILKNHYRRAKLIDITQQTIEKCRGQHFELINRHGRFIDNPSLWQRRRKEKGEPVVEVEDVLVFRKCPSTTGEISLSK